MTAYNIKASGVGSVVSKVGGHLAGEGGEGGGGLVKQLENFGTHVGEAGTAASSMPVGTALKEYVEYTTSGLKGMVTKGGACITGAVEATKAYINGDMEMLAEAQRTAVNAPAPKIGG
ncbi:hypothetical protein HUT06_14535 [Actinomadura sp. NAK00032]|uniref:DUF6507 family protein n=1 Tax=Actinomadura sp. NAK00032 TaxID=2742128 RepID=UPI0015915735|nr:DUF6507 family protein [Actinomadura sp. NAK00032]QKW35098.1 hypothetical protein HUT06_14535 [Actinomadura sp. NAK00032]